MRGAVQAFMDLQKLRFEVFRKPGCERKQRGVLGSLPVTPPLQLLIVHPCSLGEVPVAIPLLDAYQDWLCPNCGLEERSRPLPPGASRYHTCPKLHMLSAPLVRAGTRCKVEAEERADYLNGEIQATGDDGRPYMAVRTTYGDHDDLMVNAGLARARIGGLR
jgi:hypothetical protein